MHLQDLLAALDVGQRTDHLAVKAARTQQGRIEHVWTVGRGDNDDTFGAFESIHLDQQLVQGLLALVVTATQTCAAMATNRIDLVNKNDARRLLFSLLEHVAHARRADADEHLDEIGTRDREEWHLGLAGNRLGEQGLAGTRRTDHQHAARNLAAEFGELARVAQEVDEFGEFFFRLVATGDVGKGGLDLILALQFGTRTTEAHRTSTAAAGLHLAHEVNEDADEYHQRNPVKQDLQQRWAAVRRLHGELGNRFLQLDQGIVR